MLRTEFEWRDIRQKKQTLCTFESNLGWKLFSHAANSQAGKKEKSSREMAKDKSELLLVQSLLVKEEDLLICQMLAPEPLVPVGVAWVALLQHDPLFSLKI